jgi:hypothetical protein
LGELHGSRAGPGALGGCLGILTCPSDYAIVPGRQHRNLPLYRLEEDALAGDMAASWRAKRGDLLLGGGAGESAALRISIPEAIYFFTVDDWDAFVTYDQIYHAYWSANEAYVFCNGYQKSGWTPAQVVEVWLVEHILAFVRREYASRYAGMYGSVAR